MEKYFLANTSWKSSKVIEKAPINQHGVTKHTEKGRFEKGDSQASTKPKALAAKRWTWPTGPRRL